MHVQGLLWKCVDSGPQSDLLWILYHFSLWVWLEFTTRCGCNVHTFHSSNHLLSGEYSRGNRRALRVEFVSKQRSESSDFEVQDTVEVVATKNKHKGQKRTRDHESWKVKHVKKCWQRKTHQKYRVDQ